MKNHSLPPSFAKIAFSLVFAVLPALALAQDASPDGSFVWSYPIKMPPGRNGLGPSLSINYNSSGGNSFLGMGMQLGGLSAITRDQSYGITFDANDHFLLDGQKLVYVGVVDGKWRYRPERETYQKIEASGDPNNGTTNWTVTAKNGTKYLYGVRIDAVGMSSKALLWLLSQVEDVHGNYYLIEYMPDPADGDYYPFQITYTINGATGGISKYHRIEFSYETRTDAYVQYLPTRFKMDKRIKWITVKTGGNLVRKYRFDYDYGSSTHRSRLIAIQEYGSDGNWPDCPNVQSGYSPTGSTLPAATLEWSRADISINSFQAKSCIQLPNQTAEHWLIDINGDGLVDLLIWTPGYWEHFVYLGKTDGSFDNPITYIPNDYRMTYSNNSRWMVDVNGDGRADIVSWVPGQHEHYICLGKADGTFENPKIYVPNDYRMCYSNNSRWMVDVNGDGRADIVSWIAGQHEHYICLGKADGTFENPKIYVPNDYRMCYSNNSRWLVDVNGDGRADIVSWIPGQHEHYVCLGKADGTFENSITFIPDEKWVCDSASQHWMADFNGDGKTDQVSRVPGIPAYIFINYGLGTGSFSSTTTIYDQSLAYTTMLHGLADVNGDGRTDLLSLRTDEAGLYVNSATQNGFEASCKVLQFTTNEGDNWYFSSSDINGDSMSDVLICNHVIQNGYTVETRYTGYQNLVSTPDLLTSIHNPLGGSATVTYTPAAQVPGAIDSTGKTYPYTANTRPRQLVTRITLHDGLGHTQSVDFDYHNGKTQNGLPQDRKSLGFEWVTRKDSATGTYTKTWYNQTPPLHGLVSKVEVYDSANHLYSQTTYQYGTRDVATGVKFIYKTQEHVKNYDNGTEADDYQIDYAAEDYDNYGNLKKVTNQGRIGNDYDNTRVETDWIWNTNSGNYIFVPKETRTHAYNLQGVFGLASQTRYFYDNQDFGGVGTKGLVTKIVYENGDTDPEVKFGYDNYGNLVWTNDPKTPNDDTPHTSLLAYDSEYKEYLTSATNALNHTGTIHYDTLMRPVSTADANNVTSTVVYDVFSRTIKSILPGDDGTNPTMKVDYFNTPSLPTTPAYVLSQAKESGSNYLQSYRYFDGLGRVIQTKTENIAPDWTTIDYYYDASGRLWKQSVPYATNGPENSPPLENPVCTYVEFDALGRKTVRRTDGNTGVVENFQGDYQNPSYTLYATMTTKSCFDGSRITDNDGNVIQTALDMLGLSTSFSDPDMGTWAYSYDINSNLVSQTDAKNQVITLEYDVLNRPKKEYHGGVLNAEYWYDGLDVNGNPEGDHGSYKGRLTKTIWNAGSGGWESYKYDARGRIVKCTVTIGGYTKDQEFSYDSMNRVTEQRYPVGTDGPSGREIVTPAYGADGNITGISGRAQYASGMTYKVYGKLERIIYGNGVTTTYDYYDEDGETDASNGYRTHSYRLKNIHAQVGADVIADTQYEYDAVDNLIKKTFSDSFSNAYKETYSYDSFNRLVSATCDNNEPYTSLYEDKTYEYSNLNNITQKNGWDYHYETYVAGRLEKLPHAVSSITKGGNQVYSFAYDKNGNLTQQSGLTKVEIQAKRSADSLASPVMQLWVNGEKQTGWKVVNTEYSAYKWSGFWDGTSKIDVVFVNGDGPEVSVGNLFVDCVKVNGVTFQSESGSAYFDEGSTQAEWTDGQYTQTGLEQFSWSGALRFTVTGAPPLTRVIGYDYCNRVTSIDEGGSTSLYTYDPSGKRVSKVEGDTTTLYFFANYELEITGSQQTQVLYYYVNGQQIAQRKITGTTDQLLYIHKDHLGSAVRLTDESGNVVQSLAYDPFGATVYSVGVSEPTNQYTGQKKDGTGLYYYGARYYDPVLGRFISPDTVLDGLNRYAYCGNNPVRFVDPTGHFWLELGLIVIHHSK